MKNSKFSEKPRKKNPFIGKPRKNELTKFLPRNNGFGTFFPYWVFLTFSRVNGKDVNQII